jgi:hypothetical protein
MKSFNYESYEGNHLHCEHTKHGEKTEKKMQIDKNAKQQFYWIREINLVLQ